MGATGESVRRVSDAGYYPAWSPDGRQIVFSTGSFERPELLQGVAQSSLGVIDLTTGAKRRIEGATAPALQPRWSPRGDLIAYWGHRGGQRDLWVVPARGGTAVQVTADAAVDWNPFWDPQRDYLYFLSDRGGSMNLWRVRIDLRSGETLAPPEPVTLPTSYGAHAAISENSRRIVYALVRRTANIYRVPFDPQNETAVGPATPVTVGSGLVYAPAVSPDGDWLAFTSEGNQEDLMVGRTDGSGLRQLTNDAAKDRLPQWSPDGRRIAFQSNRSGQWEIWTIHPDGSGLMQLTDAGFALAASWSPDGRWLAYVSQPPGPRGTFLLEADKLWYEQVPRAVCSNLGGTEYFAGGSWSPGGEELAGRLVLPGEGFGDLAICSIPSNTVQRLSVSGSSPVWLREGRRLLFIRGQRLHILDLSSNRVHEIALAPLGDLDLRFALSHDERVLYVSSGATEADIWMGTRQ
jgi:TolB protein